MKRFPVLLAAVFALSAVAQPPAKESASEPKPAPSAKDPLGPQTRELTESSLTRHATYGGIAHDAVQSHNPLQLINPLAPAEYGWAEQNLSQDIITGKASGLKIFSINF